MMETLKMILKIVVKNNKSFLVANIYFDRRNNDLFPDKSRNL